MRYTISLLLCISCSCSVLSQVQWAICPSPFSNSGRINDVYMINEHTGYAAGGNGIIAKTTDSGKTWVTNLYHRDGYWRSIEFINERKGFAGGFPNPVNNIILAVTEDSGRTWTDITSRLPQPARKGLCGMAVADSNTIYAGGNWYDTTGYIVKSTDGGNTWGFIDMSAYTTSVIDMYFINKDEGFVTGKSTRPLETAIILHTTDGGQTWTIRYKNTTPSEYCWKIQRLTSQLYYASIEDNVNGNPKILKSADGGMNWQVLPISPATGPNHLQGVGFIDELHGWAGGWIDSTYETSNGGLTWKKTSICPIMNRAVKLNDSTLIAVGDKIWMYRKNGFPAEPPPPPPPGNGTTHAFFKAFPNPANKNNRLNIRLTLPGPTQVVLLLFNSEGRKVYTIDNNYRSAGEHHFIIPTWKFPGGVYTVFMKTHDDKQVQQVVFTH